MRFFSSICSLFVLLAFWNKLLESKPYKAGVVEYYYESQSDLDPKEMLENNLNQYVRIIEEFKQGWKANVENGIIVFPEMGLTKKVNRSNVYFPVPDPDFLNNNFQGNKLVDTISRAAQTYNTWVVVNMLETSGNKRYNTDVVFRNNGTIAARYRKYNLFGEKMDRPATPQAVSFTTDFGVTFGIFTCFDILFSRPALDLVKQGIKNFIFPSAWYSELPFLTSVQYQEAWAWSNDVTLLASGLSYSKLGSTGSGIYRGIKGPVIYHQTQNSCNSKLIMAILNNDQQELAITPEAVMKEITAVTVLQDNKFGDSDSLKTCETNLQSKQESADGIEPSLKLLQESLAAYSTQLISPEGCEIRGNKAPGEVRDCSLHLTRSLCNRGLCCEFNLTAVFNIYICKDEGCQDISKHLPTVAALDDFGLSTHRLAVFDGVRSFYVANAGLQTCAVISCRDEDLSSCGLPPQVRKPFCFSLENKLTACILRRYLPQVKVAGTFSANNTFVTPNILLGGRDINSLRFGQLSNNFKMLKESNGYVTLDFWAPTEHTPLSTVGIWSRVYDRDDQPLSTEEKNLASSLQCLGLENMLSNILISIVLMYPYLK